MLALKHCLRTTLASRRSHAAWKGEVREHCSSTGRGTPFVPSEGELRSGPDTRAAEGIPARSARATAFANSAGHLFFAYFLWRSKESERQWGRPRIGLRRMATVLRAKKIGSPPSRGQALNTTLPKTQHRHYTALSKQKCPKLPANGRVLIIRPNRTTTHTFTNLHPNRQ